MSRPAPDAVDDVVVRRATLRDCRRLAQWNHELIEDESADDPPPLDVLESRMREWLAAEYRACVFEARGAPAGYALFRELPEWLHLRQFFVARDQRRRGVGRRAFACLRDDFFPRGTRVLVEVLVGNRAAVAFWSSLGFGERYLGLQFPADAG